MSLLQDSTVYDQMSFTLLEQVDIFIGHISVKLHPKITPSMPVHKHAHAFQVNKAALTNLPTDFCLLLNTFGAQLYVGSTVEGIISN
jgi:hypothetical protein